MSAAAATTEQPVRPRTEYEALEQEFLGLTASDCCVDCTPEHCCISGTLHFKNPDGTTTKESICGHPNKTGLQPIHKTNAVIVQRYNRARKFLALVEAKNKEYGP